MRRSVLWFRWCPTRFILSWALSVLEASDDGDHGRTSDDVTRRFPQASSDLSGLTYRASRVRASRSAARVVTPSLGKIRYKWVLTVRGDKCRCSPICLFV